MERFLGHISDPVKRDNAEEYVLITLLSSVTTVLLVRVFLKLADYPQVGRGSFHIAHLLWGGLLLFVASLLPLMIANRWVYRITAFMSGIGVGLFIDEVGKFITRTDNYFYPGAAPIIYAFFLIIVLLYLRLRRRSEKDARTELYHALDTMEEVLDHDLDVEQHTELVKRLEKIAAETSYPEYSRLAQDLLKFLKSRVLELSPNSQSIWEQYAARGEIIEKRLLPRRIYKAILVVASLIFALQAFSDFQLLLNFATSSASFQHTLDTLISTGRLTNGSLLPWFLTRLIMQGVGGIILCVAAALLIVRHEKRGLIWAYFGIIFHLSVINLIVFYLDQFRAVTISFFEIGYLLAVIRYRHLYIIPLLKRRKGK